MNAELKVTVLVVEDKPQTGRSMKRDARKPMSQTM